MSSPKSKKNRNGKNQDRDEDVSKNPWAIFGSRLQEVIDEFNDAFNPDLDERVANMQNTMISDKVSTLPVISKKVKGFKGFEKLTGDFLVPGNGKAFKIKIVKDVGTRAQQTLDDVTVRVNQELSPTFLSIGKKEFDAGKHVLSSDDAMKFAKTYNLAVMMMRFSSQ